MSLLSSELTPVVPSHAAPGATAQKLKSSSSVGAIPRGSDPRLQDVANMLGLNLPPIALKILSEAQASGRLSELGKSPKVPAPATRQTTKAKRTTARSHTQPNLIKSGGASSYSRGVLTPKAVPQPLEAGKYQPPPLKARARRAALAAESKAKEASSPTNCGFPSLMEKIISTASWGDRAKSMSLPTLQPAGVAGKAGQPQVSASAASARSSRASSRAPTRPTTPTGDRLKSVSLPVLPQPASQGSTQVEASLSQADIIDKLLPRMSGILEAAGRAPLKKSNTWVAGDVPALEKSASGRTGTSPLALYKPPFPPTMEMPEVETLYEELPMIEQPAMEGPTTSPPTTTAEAGPSEPGSPPVSLQTFEELEALFLWENPCSDIPESVQIEEEPCAALDRILDLELSQVLQAEHGTAPLSRTDIEMSFLPPLNATTDMERDVEMADAEMEDLLRLAVDLLDESWVGFVDFEKYEI